MTTLEELASVPQAPEGFVKVPSWSVTAAMLRSWGFEVRETSKMMGTVIVVREGMDQNKAAHLASQKGWSFTAVRSDAEVMAAREAAKLSTTVDLDVLAWFDSIKRA